jgi:hypothetical protein
VTSASSMASFTCDTVSHRVLDLTLSYLQAAFVETGIMEEFGISHTVSILPISVFLMGLGTGPLLVGPISEVHGILPDLNPFAESS